MGFILKGDIKDVLLDLLQYRQECKGMTLEQTIKYIRLKQIITKQLKEIGCD